jgi:3-hydroxybutyryl-CoA dehydrogenase
MEIKQIRPPDINIGVVGLGLMGSSIISCLLISGHWVKAIAPISQDKIGALSRIEDQLTICKDDGLLSSSPA